MKIPGAGFVRSRRELLSRRRKLADIRKGFNSRKATDQQFAEFMMDLELADLDLSLMEERWLLPAAERWGVDIPHELWVTGNQTGRRYLDYRSRAKIRRDLADARFNFMQRWVSLLVPILSLLVALLALLVTLSSRTTSLRP